MTSTMAIPRTGRKVRSTVTADGELRLTLDDVVINPPVAEEVMVRMAAAPIHPADIMVLLAGADIAQVLRDGGTGAVVAPLSAAAQRASAARAGRPLEVGLEGAGTVVAAGAAGEALMGRRVALLSPTLGAYGEYCKVPASACLPLPDDTSARKGAAAFTNPLTALAMVETLHQIGERAMVHTAAASTIGQMLVHICAEDGIALVNIVRRQEQAELLRSLGASHVCVSSAPNYCEQLDAALAETGAMVAFDAIGGGGTASALVVAMERAAVAREQGYSPYGSSQMKRVYIYGRLDSSDTTIPKGAYGMRWSIEGWAMPPILDCAGAGRKAEMMQRIAAGLRDTFACHYGREITLDEIIDPDTMRGFGQQATGGKYLVVIDPEG